MYVWLSKSDMCKAEQAGNTEELVLSAGGIAQ